MSPRQWLAERPPSIAAGETTDAAPQAPSLPAGSLCAGALTALGQAGASDGIAASLAAAEPWQLAITLNDAVGAGLTLLIERARDDARYYQRCGRLGFWYARQEPPEGDLPKWATRMLGAVAGMLSSGFDGIADELPEAEAPSARTAVTQRGPLDNGPPPDPAQPYARLKVLGPAEVEHFFHVDYQFESGTEVDQPPTTRIGIIYQCNQPCTFCQLAEMNTHIPPARIYAALDASRAKGARRVILTGGEPTLCRDLPDYIAYAREKGYSTIELQTNATLLDKPGRAAQLRALGLTDAQVSLHGPDSEISDRLTGAPGTHQRTLAGITNLLDAGVRVLLNHLVFRDNCHLLMDFAELVERRWSPYRERLIVQFHSPLSEFARLDHARRHIARYSEYAVSLRQAIDYARTRGYAVKDLQDPTGIPALCVLGVDTDYLGPIASQRQRPRFHRWESEWMTRVDACRRCDIADACMGIPKGYIALHGDAEFHPIRFSDAAEAVE